MKKLKSLGDPDLTIFVGPEAKSFFYHPAIMVNHSEYIDTMLASPMRERKTLELHFPEIEEEEWFKMFRFRESPGKAREMTVDDIRAR